MQPQPNPTPSRTLGAWPRTPLASCLALALSLSVPSSAIMAGNEGADQRAPLALRASKVSIGALDPAEVFANIQAWRADHPRPQRLASSLSGRPNVVTNCNDDGAGSLRETIAAASVNGAIIDMSNLGCDVIGLDTSIPVHQDDLTLRGSIVSGLPHPSIQPSHNSVDTTGLLVHDGIGTLTVDSLWLTSGTRYGYGGCVSSAGSVTMSSSMVTECNAVGTNNDDALGGGIYATGMVTLDNSVISGNHASSEYGFCFGGGVFTIAGFQSTYSVVMDNRASLIDPDGTSYAGGVYSAGNTTVLHSTISGNSADVTGGLRTGGSADILVQSSTISGNTTRDSAALALGSNGGAINVIDTTVADNAISNHAFPELTVGLEIFGSPSSVTIQNSIISGNAELGFNHDLEVADGIVVSGDHNLVGDFRGDAPSGIFQRVTPLEPLADNGGPTPTHAIGAGSWAFNRGQTSATQDQRHMPRPVGTGDDIGAFESNVLFIGRFERPTAFVL